MKTCTAMILSTILFAGSTPTPGQVRTEKNSLLVGGRCEGCEAVFEYGDKKLSAVDTLPDYHETGPRLKVTGTVFQNDGKTPARDVILYVYHTDQAGMYARQGGETGWGMTHGYIRGWVKTDSMGSYTFYTLKPGAYPSRNAAAHIHPTILEPDGKYYWLESFLFEGDTLLTSEERSPRRARGMDNGILTLKKEGELLVGMKDIILGKNIPGYR